MKTTASFKNNNQEPDVFKGGEIAHRPGVYRLKNPSCAARFIVIDSRTRLYAAANGCCTASDDWFSDQREYVETNEVVTLTFQN